MQVNRNSGQGHGHPDRAVAAAIGAVGGAVVRGAEAAEANEDISVAKYLLSNFTRRCGYLVAALDARELPAE